MSCFPYVAGVAGGGAFGALAGGYIEYCHQSTKVLELAQQGDLTICTTRWPTISNGLVELTQRGIPEALQYCPRNYQFIDDLAREGGSLKIALSNSLSDVVTFLTSPMRLYDSVSSLKLLEEKAIDTAGEYFSQFGSIENVSQFVDLLKEGWELVSNGQPEYIVKAAFQLKEYYSIIENNMDNPAILTGALIGAAAGAAIVLATHVINRPTTHRRR
ncbi:MAG: hypothetical protein HGA85_07520 [Nanoarchaeota archaeon]|nr:hypothetical protein [Nanoarchaeota archaeon]